MPIRLLQRFFQLESASGLLLLLMAVLALVWANSPFNDLYEHFAAASMFWVNEGLMTIFFLVVGLELKRGLFSKQSPQGSQIRLPAVAALGGMLVPAGIYSFLNYHDSIGIKGWATPVATDIAFAAGVLALFSRRVPTGLKLFLLALAIFDDLGAILIIALFYSDHLAYHYLFLAAMVMLGLAILNKSSIQYLTPYLLLGAALWVLLLRAGIHPTVAGVLLALMIPATSHAHVSPLQRLEQGLHPWVAYFVMPLFALANAGVSFGGVTWEMLTSDVVLGIAFGLFLGKQAGVFAFSWLLIKSGWARLPHNTSFLGLYGASVVCGIGFTMSLFLGTLSFQRESSIYLIEVRLGVIIGSILSGLLGAVILRQLAVLQRSHTID